MKRMLLLTVLIALPLVTGCKKQLYHLTGTLNVSELFEVNDADGFFQSSSTISSADINSELDIPEDAVITGVEIETLYFNILLQPGNAASNVRATCYVGGIMAFSDLLLPLKNGIVSIDTLNPASVDLLKAQLNAAVRGLSSAGPVNVNLQLSANHPPIIADVDFVVRGTVNYDACLEVPDWLTKGEKCDIEEED